MQDTEIIEDFETIFTRTLSDDVKNSIIYKELKTGTRTNKTIIKGIQEDYEFRKRQFDTQEEPVRSTVKEKTLDVINAIKDTFSSSFRFADEETPEYKRYHREKLYLEKTEKLLQELHNSIEETEVLRTIVHIQDSVLRKHSSPFRSETDYKISKMQTLDDRKLAKQIKKRDGFICNNCKRKNAGTVHHLWDKYHFPQLRFQEDNLITLCDKCHTQFHQHNKKIKGNLGCSPKDYEEFKGRSPETIRNTNF